MAELVVGLAANRTSYYDNLTNTYITLEKPVQTIQYDESNMEGTVKRLERIVHALFASVPALRLYEGKVPPECIEHWKNKYLIPFNTDPTKKYRNLEGDIVAPEANRAFDRPAKVNNASADNQVASASVEEGEFEAQNVEVSNSKKNEEKPKDEEQVEEKPEEEQQQDLFDQSEEEAVQEEKKEEPKETKSKTTAKKTTRKKTTSTAKSEK